MGQQRDELDEPDERIRVAMDQQDRDGVRAFPLFMDIVKAEAVNIGTVMMEGIQLFFLLFPVEAMSPVGAQVLQIVFIGAIRPSTAGDFIGPARSSQTLTQVIQDKRRDGDGKRLDTHRWTFSLVQQKSDQQDCSSRPQGLMVYP